MRHRIRGGVALSLVVIGGVVSIGAGVCAQQAGKAQDSPVKIQFTDIRKQAGIAFVQDLHGKRRKILPRDHGHRRGLD